jgi:hypothetical protein
MVGSYYPHNPHPLSAVCDCLFNIFAVQLPSISWSLLLHLQPEDVPCHDDKGPTFGFRERWGISWLAEHTISFSRTLLHGVSYLIIPNSNEIHELVWVMTHEETFPPHFMYSLCIQYKTYTTVKFTEFLQPHFLNAKQHAAHKLNSIHR